MTAKLYATLFTAYRTIFTPIKIILGFNACCRFIPTCSHYAQEALTRHGFIHGTYLTLRRLLRCHPWGSYGIDLVPEQWPPPQPIARRVKSISASTSLTTISTTNKLASSHTPRHPSQTF